MGGFVFCLLVVVAFISILHAHNNNDIYEPATPAKVNAEFKISFFCMDEFADYFTIKHSQFPEVKWMQVVPDIDGTRHIVYLADQNGNGFSNEKRLRIIKALHSDSKFMKQVEEIGLDKGADFQHKFYAFGMNRKPSMRPANADEFKVIDSLKASVFTQKFNLGPNDLTLTEKQLFVRVQNYIDSMKA